MRTTSGTVRLPARELRRIQDHARATYPRECCGALLGRVTSSGGRDREVVHTVPLGNAWSEGGVEGTNHRYLIPAGAVRSIERAAERDGLEIIGFYHSHPDHPAVPSAFDREHGWPWYVYLIVPVRKRAVGEARGWRLTDDRGEFMEDSVTILEDS